MIMVIICNYKTLKIFLFNILLLKEYNKLISLMKKTSKGNCFKNLNFSYQFS